MNKQTPTHPANKDTDPGHSGGPVRILIQSRNSAFVASMRDIIGDLSGRQMAIGDLCSTIPNIGMIVLHNPSLDDEDVMGWVSTNLAQSPEHRIPFLVVADSYDSRTVLKWLKQGAIDCMSLNMARIAMLLETTTLGKWKRSQRAQPTPASNSGLLFGCSQMRAIAEQIERLGKTDTNILLTGETGTGKTAIAQAIHRVSRPGSDRFCVVNCGSIPSTLIEGELFGHRKGSFTGADVNRQGRFSEVGRGTLLLDEIDTLPLECQPKILRAVETHEFEAIGDNRPQHFHGRLISATNENLSRLVEHGTFRRDLYYRLGVVEIALPPLRERREEIGLMANRFIESYAERNHVPQKWLSDDAMCQLKEHSWPGNLRELRNVIEKAMIFTESDVIDEVQLRTAAGNVAANVQIASEQKTLVAARGAGEAQLLRRTLEQCNNNRSMAARQLGISRAALYKKLAKHSIN